MRDPEYAPKGTVAPISSTAFDRGYANRTLALFLVLALVIIYNETMLIPSLPQIGSEYGISIGQASLTISLALVFGVALVPFVGKLGDIYGKKQVLNYVLATYLGTVVGAAFAPDFFLLLIFRTVQGVGVALFPLAFSLVREEYPRELIPRAEGMIGAIECGVASSLGLVLGALVTSSLGWQTNFRIVLPVVGLLVVLAHVWVKESSYRRPDARVDLAGGAWLGISLGALVLGLSEGATWGWTSLPTVGLIFGGLVLLAPLAAYELRVSDPVLDRRLLRSRNVAIANVLIMVTAVAVYAGFLLVTYRLELPPPSGFGLDPFLTGVQYSAIH